MNEKELIEAYGKKIGCPTLTAEQLIHSHERLYEDLRMYRERFNENWNHGHEAGVKYAKEHSCISWKELLKMSVEDFCRMGAE